MQITGQQIHEAFCFVHGSGQRWEDVSEGSKAKYGCMAERLMVLIERQAAIERLRAAGELEEQRQV